MDGQLVLGEPVGPVAAPRPARRSGRRRGAARLAVDELAHVGDQRRRAAPTHASGPTAAPPTSVVDQLAEPGLVPVGHAEQLADHGDRQRVGVRRDEVGFAVLGERGGEVVEEAVGDLLDPRARARSTRRRVNASETSRRSRVWSGGSLCRRSLFIAALTSGGNSPSRGVGPGLLTRRGSLSAARTAS